MGIQRRLSLIIILIFIFTPLIGAFAQNIEYGYTSGETSWTSPEFETQSSTEMHWWAEAIPNANNPSFRLDIMEPGMPGPVDSKFHSGYQDTIIGFPFPSVEKWFYFIVTTEEIRVWQFKLFRLATAPITTATTTTTSPSTDTTTTPTTTDPNNPPATVTILVGVITTTQQITIVQSLVETTTVAVTTQWQTYVVYTELPPDARMVTVGYGIVGVLIMFMVASAGILYVLKKKGDILILEKEKHRGDVNSENETLRRRKRDENTDGIKVVK